MASSLRQKTAPSGANYAEGGQDTLGTSTVPWKDVHTVNLTAKGDVVIEGDLTITGDANEVTVSQLAVDETLIKLGKTNTGTTADIGLVGAEDTDGTPVYSGFARDASDGNKVWQTFEGLATDPLSGDGTTVDFSSASLGTIKTKIIVPDGEFTLGTEAVTSTASELNLLDGVSAGAVSASLAVVADSSKDISGFRNVSLDSTLTASTVSSSVISSNDAELTIDASALDTAQFTVKLPEAKEDALSISAGASDYIVLDTADSQIQFEQALTSKDITVADGSTLDVSAATLTLAAGQISADKVSEGTFAAGTYSFTGSELTSLGTVKALDVSTGTLTLADDQIPASKVTGLDGAGLADADGVLSVNVDSASILIDGDTLEVGTITNANIDDSSISSAKLSDLPSAVNGILEAGTGIAITSSSTISIGQAVGTTDNVTFNNLTLSGEVISSLTPSVDSSVNLGSSEKAWLNLYADNVAAATLTATTADIDGGTIDGTTISASNINVGAGKELDVSGGSLVTSAAQKKAIIEGAASDVSFGTYDVTAATFVGKISTLSNHTTTNLAEGTNLYYTDERVDDRVSALLVEGEAIDLTYDDGAGTLTIAAEDASDSNKGVASFASSDFSVTSGAVSIKDSGVSNAQLENSITTLGSTALTLGATNTVIAGMDKITATTFSGALEGNATTASALASSFTINVAGDVAGSVTTDGTGIAALSLTIQPDSVALGTDTTGSYIATLNESGSNSDFVLAQNNQENGAATIALATISGLTAGTYGSATEIPVVQLDTRGRVRSISTADVATSLAFEGDSGTDSLALLGGTLTFAGGTALTSTVSDDQVSFALDNTAVTAGNYGEASKSLSITVDAQGRLTAATHQDITIDHTQITDFDAEVTDLAGALVAGATTSNLSTSYDAGTDALSISVETATATTLGVAKFNGANFDVTAGSVEIKDGGVTNAKLDNSGFSIQGTTGAGLGGATISPDLGQTVTFSSAASNNIVIAADSSFNSLDFDLADDVSIAQSLAINGVTLDHVDIAKIDSITNGTAAADKALVLDGSSKITSGLKSIFSEQFTDGTATLASGAFTGLTNLTVDNVNIDSNTIKSNSGDLTLDAASGSLYINYGDNLTIRQNTFDGTGGSVDIEGTLSTDAVRRNVILKTANYTFDNSDVPNDHIVLFDATSAGGNLTFTLPAANDSNMTFRECIVKNVGTANNIIISSTSDIDAVSTTLTPGDILKVVSTTTKWCQI
jgi:hypothetical protein